VKITELVVDGRVEAYLSVPLWLRAFLSPLFDSLEILVFFREERITPILLLIPLLVLHLMVLAIGCGIIVSSVTTKYRDLAMLVSFGLQLWQYGSPVAYGLELVPLRYRGLYLLNPVSPILTAFRYALFGAGFFSLRYYVISLIVTLAVFLIGLILFSRIERTFMDTI
jgi:lipopolysaccharide transport system permease protein